MRPLSVLLTLTLLGASTALAEPSSTRGLDTIEVSAPEGPAAIGISNYRAVLFSAMDYGEESGIPDLVTPGRDITEIGRVLKDRFGFKVEIVQNATEDAIIRHLDALKAETEEDDGLLIYFAGHGLYDEAENRGFWLPTDAVLTQTSRWVSNEDVSAKLRAIPARHVLMVVDSCFSGMFRDVPRPTGAVQDLAPLQRLAAKRSRVVLTSGGNEPVSDSGRDGMSVFAYFLREGLEQVEGRYVVVDTLFPELRARVQQNAAQTPQQGVFQRAFHEGGQLVLVNQQAPEGTVVARAVDRSTAEKQCKARSDRDRDTYEALGGASAAEQLIQLQTVDRKTRARVGLHACVDHAMGLITDQEYATLKALLNGDRKAQAALSKLALAEQRANAREVPPPDRCEVTDPESADALVRAQRLLKEGSGRSNRPEDQEALSLLETTAQSSDRAPVWAALARARFYTGAGADDVSEAAERAAEACPDWGVPDVYRANALALENKLPEALAALQRAVERSPEYAFAHYNLGLILSQSDLAASMRTLEEAIRKDPLLGEAHSLKGRLLLAMRKPAEALPFLESASDLRPGMKSVWESLAQAYEATGNPTAARLAKQRASEL